MPRVLVVDGDARVRQQILRLLSAEGHEAFEASGMEQVIAWTTTQVVDIVVCAVEPPGASVAELRKIVTRGLAPHALFIFLATDFDGDLSKLSGTSPSTHLVILKKPVELQLLSWLIRSLAGNLQQFKGDFEDNSLHRLFEHIHSNDESGVLTAYRRSVIKKLVFSSGRLVFCTSGDGWERIGQWCVQAGLINDTELQEALKVQVHTVEPLLRILEALQKVDRPQGLELLEKKFREGALDLFLWPSGSWSYERGVSEVEHKLDEGIPTRDLQVEGTRRAERWRELVTMFPSDRTRLDVVKENFPDNFPSSRSDRRLIKLLQAGLTVRQICDRFAGQQFHVLSRFGEFMSMRVVELSPLPPTMDPHEDEDDDGFGGMMDHTVTLNPTRLPMAIAPPAAPPSAGLPQKLNSNRLNLESNVRLTVPLQKLLDESVHGYEAFVLSRLASGTVAVSVLINDCPMTESQLLEILDRYIQRGVLALE